MKAYVLNNIKEYSIKNVNIPEIGDYDTLVKVKAAGICGSDIPRIYKSGTYHYPLIPGHEFSGIVEMTGKNASDMRSKRVGVFPLIPCMKCAQRIDKKYEMCKNYNYLGSRTDGGYAEYVKVPLWNLIELPDNVSFEQAAMLEPMAVSVHAARRAGLLKNDKSDRNLRIMIMGLGAIGMSLAMMLISEGYKYVYVCGNKELQKQTAFKLNVAHDFYVDINELAAMDKDFDVFFDCVGTNEVVDIALNSVRPSGTVVLVGNPASDMAVNRNSYWQILRKQLTLVGTWNSSFTHENSDDWHYVLNKLKSGSIHPEQMISHRFSFDEMMSGFELMRDKSEPYIKVMGIFS